MRSDRRGVILPSVLAVLLATAMLSALALTGAATEARVAALAVDRLVARSAGIEGLAQVGAPADVAALCLGPPVLAVEREVRALAGGSARLRWRHLGGGLVRADVEGRGKQGARQRWVALLRADPPPPASPFIGCPSATRLVPAGAGWLEAHPEG